uniref:Ionotropic glutamate receptor C-terminal domain-containing protein n=2 Tax=Plectus sambesii TaxID=2011161 RepID=A0A914UQJ0_9BILA
MPRSAILFRLIFAGVAVVVVVVSAPPPSIQFGGIFHEANVEQRFVFAYAVKNLESKKEFEGKRVFSPMIETVADADAIRSYDKACALLMTKSVAIFGPSSDPALSQVQSLCDTKEVPHVMIGQAPAYDSSINDLPKSFSINLFPPARTIGLALAEVVRFYRWKSFVVLYEHGHDLLELQDLLSLSSVPRGPRIGVRRLPANHDFGPLLKEIKNRIEEFHLVVYSGLETARSLLEQAARFSMAADYYHYIFTHLDLYTLDLEAYKSSGCNITGLRFVNTDSPKTTQLIQGLRSYLSEQKEPTFVLPSVGVPTSVAVLYDSVNVLADALIRTGPLVPAEVSCQQDHTWRNGSTFMTFIKLEADLAVASLTISYSRSEVIDFTVPFMHLGISILFKKPEKKDPSLFTFLSPLSLDVWIYMLAAYVGVSLMLWILARFSPYEWYNPHPCNPDTDVVENQFNLLNSLWFTVGSLMQQGSDLTPRAASTRLVAGIWWFFTLILISSYTANLAAFLTVERMVSPIESADDLAKQTKIKYGTLGSGSTMTFFNESKIQTYERMWQFMESQPNVFVNSSREGIERSRNGDYAYLMESSMLEYAIERDCDLMQIGGLLDSKGYGIGLPKGSPFREPISTAILRLQEKTVLTELKDKWWKQKRGGGKCANEDSKKGGHNELGLQNVGGVFVVLVGGLCIAFVIAIIEFVHKSRKNAEVDRRPLCSEMWDELKFAMRCHGSRKPVRSKSRQSFSAGGSITEDARGFGAPPYGPAGYAPVATRDNQQQFYNMYREEYDKQ